MRRTLYLTCVVLVPFVAWTLLAFITPRYLVARPTDVALLLFGSWRSFLFDTAVTVWESVAGLAIGLIISIITVVAFRLVRRLESLIMPYAIALKSIPIVAIGPLLVIWLGNGFAGKIVLAALICFFPLLIGLSDGMKSLPRELVFLAAVWSKSKVRTLWLLEFPFAIPYLFSALKIAAPLATVGAVVAEFSGADKGLGHATLVAAYRADTVLLFASVILVSLLGIGLYSIVAGIEKLYLKSMRVQRVLRTF
jgi:NitT/TauT family transport system permease protein